MRKIILILAIVLVGTQAYSQTLIRGKVTDSDGQPLTGANVMLKGTYDGIGTDATGNYSFTTSERGKQIVIVSFIGFAIQEKEVELLGATIELSFSLKEESNRIADVVISAGTFETSDRKKSVTLQPLDILTTPSAAGDIYGALTTLPGASMVGEDGRLFVRGGDGYESKTFIDGLLVKKPYSSNTPDLPSRGRFSPTLFSGTTFSTGGYSAEYGQALSSALILTTNAFPKKTQTDIQLMTVGVGATQTYAGKNASLSIGAEYYNLKPYFSIINQEVEWNRFPQSLGLVLTSRIRTKGDGVLKIFSTYSSALSGLRYPEMTTPGAMQNIKLDNKNSYTNINYNRSINSWSVKGGVAFTYDENLIGMKAFEVNDYNTNFQLRFSMKRKFSDRFSLNMGGEETVNLFNEKYHEFSPTILFEGTVKDFNSAIFSEVEVRPLSRLVVRAGLRGENASIINDAKLAVRTSAAWLISKDIQLSMIYGTFYQTPEESAMKFKPQLGYEKAEHYIANVQYEKNNRILRVESYYKKYNDFVAYDTTHFFNEPLYYNNSGYGDSKGIDVYYRDRKTFKNLDYWVSYSFIDSKRKYRGYPSYVTPPFASTHNFTVVAKQWVQKITTLFGATFAWSSGRPYHDPNSTKFMDKITSDYMDISLNVSHLCELFGKSTILYASMSNVLGRDNIYGYRYYSTQNSTGVYESIPVRSESKRFILFGVFITLD
ncbi:MAG: TonB-dependent receptor [Bacteroidales bacterium]|nr:MAG: TonB-dependent receptor [Bacteroidales bacterium]